MAEGIPIVLVELGLEELAVAWTSGSPARAWHECEQPVSLTRIAVRLGCDRRRIVRAAAACVEPCLVKIPEWEREPALAAFRAAVAWAESPELHAAGAWAAAFGAMDAASRLDESAAAAARACAALAFACDAEADRAYYAERAHAVEAVSAALDVLGRERGPALARAIRARIPSTHVADRLTAVLRESHEFEVRMAEPPTYADTGTY